VLVAVLAVLAARHDASLIALGPTAALIGAGEGLFLPASFSILPSLLDGERLGAGNALSSAAVQAGSLLGPALGGALVAITRASTAAFAVDAVSFGISALTLALIRPAGQPVQPQAAEPARQESVLKLLVGWRPMQVIFVVTIAANLAGGGMSEVALPSLAHAHWGAGGYGAILACFAAGALIGTLGATRTTRVPRPATFISVVFMVDALAVALIPFLGGEAGAAIAFFVAGATNGMGNVVAITMVQRAISPALIGRIMGAIILCSVGSFPVSVAVTGLLVNHLGPVPFFPIAGATLGAAMLFGLSQREFRIFGTPQATPLDQTPRTQAAEGSRR
jgi:hypothetical protein